MGRLGHGCRSILRPRYTDFEEKFVSRHVGTGGFAEVCGIGAIDACDELSVTFEHMLSSLRSAKNPSFVILPEHVARPSPACIIECRAYTSALGAPFDGVLAALGRLRLITRAAARRQGRRVGEGVRAGDDVHCALRDRGPAGGHRAAADHGDKQARASCERRADDPSRCRGTSPHDQADAGVDLDDSSDHLGAPSRNLKVPRLRRRRRGQASKWRVRLYCAVCDPESDVDGARTA